ncbi:hypothetical protein DPEC_G00044610 [Dallia pectoralis]|uniref:Uncharacterized protein n=1 Tax=Dallia pectoralis TaxID=75939 RepID=A0ACC2H9Z9_DALPE|nr:hypothetical protein DPEC_G00044610 [Dallia pectoralis]
MSDLSFSSSASTVILDEIPRKRLRMEDTNDGVSAKQLIEAVLTGTSGGEEVLQEYQTTETLTDATRRKMINILVARMIDNHGQLPTKAVREEYALGIVMLFPSLKDPYSNKGYSCCSLKEHLGNEPGRQPYLLAVGRQKSKVDRFYITMDKHLIPCKANRSLGAFDELFKAHFVFNLSYDAALGNFYTFLQTTVYNIDVGKMKESPRVRDLRARLLNHTVGLSNCE